MYAKVFESMYHGSLATEGPWQALVTFQQLLVLSDRAGVVDMTPEAIARITTVPLDIIRTGLAALEQPDPHSRSSEHEGRRILRLSDERDWGWQIVNHAKYRAIRSAEERRDYMREYMREKRAEESGAEPARKNGRALDITALPEQWRTFCTETRPKLDPEQTFFQFRDYWVANANQARGKKLDWFAAWRTWVRKERP